MLPIYDSFVYQYKIDFVGESYVFVLSGFKHPVMSFLFSRILIVPFKCFVEF